MLKEATKTLTGLERGETLRVVMIDEAAAEVCTVERDFVCRLQRVRRTLKVSSRELVLVRESQDCIGEARLTDSMQFQAS